LPDFSWKNTLNAQKIYRLVIKYTTWPLNLPIFYIPRLSKICRKKWNFWFANLPSGNPGENTLEKH
jgi:hypothetical protein